MRATKSPTHLQGHILVGEWDTKPGTYPVGSRLCVLAFWRCRYQGPLWWGPMWPFPKVPQGLCYAHLTRVALSPCILVHHTLWPYSAPFDLSYFLIRRILINVELSAQTIMPIPDRLLEVPKHQADCEIIGKPHQVFPQCWFETLIFFLFSPQILTCCLLRPHPPPKLVPHARELARAPREAQGNDFMVGRAILSATQCLLCWFLALPGCPILS